MLSKINAFLCKYIGSVGQSLDKVAQVGHILGGMVVPLIFALIPFAHSALWGAFAVDVVWAFPKEFYIDPMCEHASFADGFYDAWHYWLGSGVSLIILAIAHGRV